MNSIEISYKDGTKETKSVSRMVGDKFCITTNGLLVKVTNGEILPLDEPLFLMRARDTFSLPTIEHFKKLCEQVVGLDWQVEHMNKIIAQFKEWRETHQDRMKLPGITRGL